MRLLNVHSRLLEEFLDLDFAPPYAILSHIWGQNEIEGCCRQAIRDQHDYIWVDTCCIDKKDPTELSEAINSMFRWYQKSVVCYAYLADVEAGEEGHVDDSLFKNSRWFTRGWTLQELCKRDNNKKYSDLRRVDTPLLSITRIRASGLYNPYDDTITAAEKLSWVSHRKTTRKEDMAYCLLRILGIHMPLLYGEGDRAFIWLQEEYIRNHNDPSLLLWGFGVPCADILQLRQLNLPIGALAPSPVAFADFGARNRAFDNNTMPSPSSRTNNGYEVHLLILTLDRTRSLACFDSYGSFYAHYRSKITNRIHTLFPRRGNYKYYDTVAVPLLNCYSDPIRQMEVYERAILWPPFFIPGEWCRKAQWKPAYLKAENTSFLHNELRYENDFRVDIHLLSESGFRHESVYPPAPDRITCNDDEILIQMSGRISGLGLFIDCQYNLETYKHTLCLNAFIEKARIADSLYHLLLPDRSFNLWDRIRGVNGIDRIRKNLSRTKSVQYSGEELDQAGVDHAIVSVPAEEFRADTDASGLPTIVVQWEEKLGSNVRSSSGIVTDYINADY
ncbi:HET-domain-containing protein [Camillea tinctor]|nr:HET-domain-containing protein [Camillea tinctor]